MRMRASHLASRDIGRVGRNSALDQGELGQYRAMLCRFLLFLLRDPHDAEELAQETFRVAISKGADPAKGTDYGAWLRSIARNLVRNHVRKHRRRALLRGDVVALAERRFVETGADRDEVWEARRAALARCMARLPEDDQALLRRRHFGSPDPGHTSGYRHDPVLESHVMPELQ